MKQLINLLLATFAVQISAAQNVGIGTTTPNAAALLHVNTGTSNTKGLLVTGNYNYSSIIPDLGAGSRLMFYPGKGAFRAGFVIGTQWDNTNVGLISTAMGYSTTASGEISTAMGRTTTASGHTSTALGYTTIASGPHSTSLGRSTAASGFASTAMGYITTASGHYSVAIGRNVSTNGHTGAFFFGDSDPNNKGVRPIGFANQIAMRFNGGYYFISSDAGDDIGVRVSAGGNAWLTLSDAKRKENFTAVNGEAFLQKIRGMNLSSWNYIGQDPRTFRHYGPMAQEFHAAFGRDSYGTIGDDTTINGADFDGINLIAIQALEKRTTALKQENEALQKENLALQQQNKTLEARLEKLERLLTAKQ